jgi:hypothetical protein
MELKSLKFTFEDFVKLAGFMVTFLVGYYNLVSEIRENKIVNNADKVIINFRLDKIESALNITRVPSSVAILPSQPNVPKKDDE